MIKHAGVISIFNKCIGLIPDDCWSLLIFWHSDFCVHIKWGGKLSRSIPVMKGTRQRGLSSPYLFNIFYQGLVDRISGTVRGIKINGSSYKLFCYADDLLLTSVTASGLHCLINASNGYITAHGLRFNPSKTQCITFGKSTLFPNPTWSINGVVMQTVDKIKYLGVIIANSSWYHI
jgi:hypothetical protein